MCLRHSLSDNSCHEFLIENCSVHSSAVYKMIYAQKIWKISNTLKKSSNQKYCVQIFFQYFHSFIVISVMFL